MQIPLRFTRTPRRIFSFLALPFFVLYLAGCSGREQPNTATASQSNASTNAAADTYPTYTYDVIKVWPHDRGAFTQGLVYLDGALLESTGLNGESSLRKVDLETGNSLKHVDVSPEYFAEGLALFDGKLFQLTWQNHKCFVYDLETFQKEKGIYL